MDKLEELKSKIEQFQAKSAAKDEIKAFVTLVVAVLKKSKENFESISDENITQIQEAIAKIEEMRAETISRVDDTTNKAVEKASKELNAKLKEIKAIFAEIQATKPRDGEPGKDADEEKIVEDVLAKIKLPEYEVFTLEERGKEIVDEINALPTDDNDFKIDASHIKNLPKSGGGVVGGGIRFLSNLQDVALTAPSDGQALVYDSTTGYWVNDTVSGGGGGSTWFFDQTPTDGGTYTLLQGDIDGANQTFTVSEGQYISGSLIVILNGQVLSQGADANEWEEDNFSIGTFTLNTAPSGTDELQAFYTTTAGGGGGNAAGSDTQVQFNDAGALNGDPTFTFNKTTNELTVATVLVDDEAYGAGWNGDLSVPTKNAVYDKIQSLPSGDVTKVGTPVNNQIGVWTGDGTIEGDVDLTFDTTTNTLGVGLIGLDGRVQVHAVKSDASDGLLIEAANGTDVSLFGVGNTANATHYGVHQFPTEGVQIGSSVPFADSAGTLTLQNVDALDATTEATIEAAIDTLANLTSIQGRTVTLADAGANAIFGWDDVAGAYENLTQAEVKAVIGSASDTATGVVELATAAETTTGTDTSRAVTPDGFAGSDYGKRVVNILVSDPLGSAITTGDGKACFRVPSVMNGWNLVTVSGSLSTVSSSGLPTFQIRRSRRSTATTRTDADMLSTKLSIDASEFDSVDATTAVVIDTANDDVNTGDMIYIDIDVAGTGAKGLVAELTFQLP